MVRRAYQASGEVGKAVGLHVRRLRVIAGILSWYNEVGAYAPLGERGDLMPFYGVGVSVSF
jgi:hypothetical protein